MYFPIAEFVASVQLTISSNLHYCRFLQLLMGILGVQHSLQQASDPRAFFKGTDDSVEGDGVWLHGALPQTPTWLARSRKAKRPPLPSSTSGRHEQLPVTLVTSQSETSPRYPTPPVLYMAYSLAAQTLNPTLSKTNMESEVGS